MEKSLNTEDKIQIKSRERSRRKGNNRLNKKLIYPIAKT